MRGVIQMATKKLTVEKMKKNYNGWVKRLPFTTTGMALIFIVVQFVVGSMKGKQMMTTDFLIYAVLFLLFGIILGLILKFLYGRFGDVLEDEDKKG